MSVREGGREGDNLGAHWLTGGDAGRQTVSKTVSHTARLVGIQSYYLRFNLS